jgi:hypothetical protein
MRIGTIRWDAYYETKEPKSPSSQVARALSPQEYHHIAPFFAKVTTKGDIKFDEYTLDIWEKEADYAIDAGIDYFAYCWYRDNDLLSTARKHHVQSEKHDNIKMCAILGVNPMDNITMQQLYSAMKEEYYIKNESGNPLVYVYGGFNSLDKDGVAHLRQEAREAGVEKSLFVSVMMPILDLEKCEKIKVCGYDAVSFYSNVPISPAMQYEEFAHSTELRNETVSKYCKNLQLKIIPSFNAGMATKPRLDHPVSWASGYGGNFTTWGTPTQIAAHAENVINWAKEHSKLVGVDFVISYAWNEHDEGGWLCPTLTTDENGTPILDDNGVPKADTSILDAVKKVLQKVK